MSCPHQPNRMRHDAAPSETTLPEVAIRKADRLSVTACCEAPRARLAFEVRKRVDPHSEHVRRQRPFQPRDRLADSPPENEHDFRHSARRRRAARMTEAERPARVAVVYYSATGNVHALARAVSEGAAREGAEVRLRHVAELNQEMLISVKQYWGRHRSEIEDQPEAAARGHRLGRRHRLRNTHPLWQRRRAAEAVPRPHWRALAAGKADRQGRHGVHVLADRARRARIDDPRPQQHAVPLGGDRAPARVHGARSLQRGRKPVRHVLHE